MVVGESKSQLGRQRGKKSVVSVAFDPADLTQVHEAARKAGVSMSEFLRDSAVVRATKQTGQGSILGISGLTGVRVIREDMTTASRTSRIKMESNAETY